MIELPYETTLTRISDGARTPAQIVSLTRELAKLRIDAQWWQLPGVASRVRGAENDHGWQWRTEVGALVNQRWWECVAVSTDDGELQGGMILRLDAKSFLDDSLGAVHVHAIATAPRNRDWLVSQPQFRGVGSALLRHAVARSYELGLEGRVNLFAFDDPRTISFYENRGFDRIEGQDELIQEPMLELSPAAAIEHLRELGYEL
jgi:GNAT superfamily N-acetyltransferase